MEDKNRWTVSFKINKAEHDILEDYANSLTGSISELMRMATRDLLDSLDDNKQLVLPPETRYLLIERRYKRKAEMKKKLDQDWLRLKQCPDAEKFNICGEIADKWNLDWPPDEKNIKPEEADPVLDKVLQAVRDNINGDGKTANYRDVYRQAHMDKDECTKYVLELEKLKKVSFDQDNGKVVLL